MAVQHIRVRIGASLDSSVDAAFGSLRSKSRKAGQEVARELNRGMAAGSAGAAGSRVSPIEAQARNAAKAHAQAMRAIERNERDRARTTERETQRAAKAEERAFSERLRSARKAAAEHERMERQKSRSSERAAREEIRNAQRVASAEARIRARSTDRFVTRTSHRASRFFWPNAPITQTARRVGMDIARGAGVETNLAGVVGNVVQADKMARSVAVQAYQPGAEGAAGARVDPEVLKRESAAVAENFALARTEVLGGLKSFVDMRGNLQGARDLMSDMASLAKSQSADFTEVMHTAAKIDSALASQKEYAGDTAKTYDTIRSIMRGVVYQGKIGSVTIEQMAKQIPKLSGIAASFSGDAGKNILLLTTATQLAERGPAKNPATAATYVQSLALDLPKRASVIEKATGRSIFDDSNKMRGLDKIIEEMLAATQNTVRRKDSKTGQMTNMTQIQQLGDLLPNKRSFLAIQEFLNVFQGAGKGKAGIAAVRGEFAANTKMLSKGQEQQDLALTLKGTAAQAEIFNAKLEQLTETMLSNALPALSKMEGPALSVAKHLGDLVAWAAEHPWQALFGAATIATTRAAIESTFRASIEAAIYRGTGSIVTESGRVSGGLAPVGTQAGFVSSGLARVAIQTGVTILAMYSLSQAAEQASKLWKAIKSFDTGDLGKGGEDPESGVGKAREAAKKPFMRAASAIEGRATSALWGATSFGPGAAPGMAAASLKVHGQFAGVEAARAAVGEGKSSSTAAFFDVSQTAKSAEDVMAKLDPRNWSRAADREPKTVEQKLEQINATLKQGIRISNLQDISTPKPGAGVDNGARDVE